MLDGKTKYHINPTGRFVIGGPMGDAGVTGRKIIVDSYGGIAGTAAGRFRARIPARWIVRRATWRDISPRILWLRDWLRRRKCSWLTPSELRSRFRAETFGTAKVSEERITSLIAEFFSLTPKGIIETLNLRRPI